MSPELSACEATQFAVAATNQNAVGRAQPVHVKDDSESESDMSKTGELTRFTATQFRRN